jgi:hypothetical protein
MPVLQPVAMVRCSAIGAILTELQCSTTPMVATSTFHRERRVIVLVYFSFRVLPKCERFHLALKYCCSYVLLPFNLVLLQYCGDCLRQVDDKYKIPQM